ncbi:MAG: SLC13 family permease, partial [Planctomycetota bacterium]
LTKRLFRVEWQDQGESRSFIAGEYEKLGSMGRGERAVLWVFTLTAVFWIARGPLARWDLFVSWFPFWPRIHDAAIGLTGAIALFLIPVDRRRGVFALDWETAVKIPWGMLLLLGGGLSLASAVRETGLAEWIGGQISTDLPLFALVILCTAIVVFLTELTSNIATTSAFLPVLGGIAVRLGVDPRWLAVPVTIAASCAFMLPVATPPNAIVFGSGKVEIGDMVRAGLRLNVISVILVPLLAYAMIQWCWTI